MESQQAGKVASDSAVETRHFLSLGAVKGIEFTCKKCWVRITLIPGEPLKRNNVAPYSCWNCGESFTGRNTALENAFERFVILIGEIAKRKAEAPAELRLEISAENEVGVDAAKTVSAGPPEKTV